MGFQGLSAVSAPSGKGISGLSWPVLDKLRAENLRLREEAQAARDAAARCQIMLREGDHRIKNSLQIVASLMMLQARREESSTARSALQSAAARIQSVARIHDALQATVGVDTVDLGKVLETMCWSLQAMAGDPRSVTVVVDVQPIEAVVALAQPIALAINELVVNALRHAFPDGRPGVVRVSVTHEDGHLKVVVADDGVGLPEGYADGHGYGMTLVRSVVSQVGGALKIESPPGACFTLTAPAPQGLVLVR